jgi:hypothetical protein
LLESGELAFTWGNGTAAPSQGGEEGPYECPQRARLDHFLSSPLIDAMASANTGSTALPSRFSWSITNIIALRSLCAHVIEIWLFAFGYYFMISSGAFGTLQGNFTNTLRDCSYFSFTTYSTLGVGDIEPVGHIRFLMGLESLTGLVLITWTASFMFVEMQKFWEHK